jgi:hypothetical protein
MQYQGANFPIAADKTCDNPPWQSTQAQNLSDATFAEIKRHLSDEHMTDLVLTIAFYCAVVRVLATMKIDNEPHYKEVLKQYPMA